MSKPKRVALLGCSGSIGKQTIDVIDSHRELFKLAAVTVNENIDYLSEVCQYHSPAYIGIANENAAKAFSPPHYCEIAAGISCNEAAAIRDDVDIVVIAISGMLAIFPLMAAIKANKHIAIANKEAIVCGGELFAQALRKSDAKLVPIDSEQSAIFQCLENVNRQNVEKVILTMSGGPFFDLSECEFRNITIEKALDHPTWKGMGQKITIDCATHANKGLEVLEAYFLFGIENISVLRHPQSIIHSMVELVDGSILAQIASSDMRIPIQYALTHPHRISCSAKRLDFNSMLSLEFMPPDLVKFPALRLAFDALKAKANAPTIYDASNSAAVELFVKGAIGFREIPVVIEEALNTLERKPLNSVNEISECAEITRKLCFNLFGKERK